MQTFTNWSALTSDHDEYITDGVVDYEIRLVPDPIPVQPLVDWAQSQRRQRAPSELEDREHEDDGQPGLPDTENRHSGRVRKPSRLLDGYKVVA